jgi:glycosyltransferase involved in cell wall biosynthesis
MRIALLSGGFPPQFDGIGDHTWWLSQELASQGHQVTVFTSFAHDRPKPIGVEVTCCFDPARPRTIQSFPASLRAAGGFDWLVLQYNPFSFGPRGFAPWLIPALKKAWTPLALMIHETYVPAWPWRFTLMRLWQHPQLALLVRMAQALLVTTERWTPQIRPWTKKRPLLLPVGSNLPRCPLTKGEAKARLGLPMDALLIGTFGFGHISKRTNWVSAAARQIHQRFPQTRLLNVGQLNHSLSAACRPAPVDQPGPLPGPEASLRLRAMDVFLAPFVDGVSPRRGSVVAAFQHGIPVCSTFREYTDRLLLEFVSPAFSLAPSNDERRFTESALTMAGKAVQEPDLGNDLIGFHDRYFAWPVVVQRLVQELESSGNGSAPKEDLLNS